MSLEGLIFAAALAGVVLLLVLSPLFTVKNTTPSLLEREQQLQGLLITYEMVLANINDLDEDHLTGKITDDAHRTEREQWLQQGIRVLRDIDRLQAAPSVTTQMDEDRVEAALQAYRADHSASTQQG